MSINPSFREDGRNLAAQAAGIGALADPVRRALYEYVAAQPDPAGREAAAAAVGVPVHTAKFHLDRLCAEGLLETEFRRLTGRTGPGAGRPAKLYRRASRQFTVTLPERRYDLAARILATAVEQAGAGTPLADALSTSAYAEGSRLGAAASAAGPDLSRLARALATQGFEPRVSDDTVGLANCPFDALAREHTSLMCGLNRWYVQGVADGLGCRAIQARLDPAPGRCCVRAGQAASLDEVRRAVEPEDTPGDLACWAGLVCQECGAVLSEGHRDGCSQRPATPAPQ
jgi:predicted ArsR family transcriptional regulator